MENNNNFDINWPNIFSKKENILNEYKDYCYEKLIGASIGKDREYPTLHVLKNGKYAIWNGGISWPQSAWNNSIEIEGAGWVSSSIIDDRDYKSTGWHEERGEFTGFVNWPVYTKSKIKETSKIIKLSGKYVGFHTWWSHNYGHILHDALPYFLWLKSQVSGDCKYIMLNDPVKKDIIKNLDLDLYNSIVWLNLGETAEIDGELIVSTPDMHPCIMGKKFQKYLKEWLNKCGEGKTKCGDIIYHSRHGTTNRRLLDQEHEKHIIETIKVLMEKNKIKGDLKIFSGKDSEGNTLSVEEQINIFRNAHTIIGPHSSGLINILYSNLDNVNLVEFIPSYECAEVQEPFNGYHMAIQGLGINHNILLYTDDSVSEKTFIDIDDLHDALNKIWGKPS